MNNEIKEILDRAKKLKDKCSCCEQIGNGVYISKYHEIETQNLAEAVYIINRLLDYITNLQEENERLKEDIEDISVSHFSLFKQKEDYKSRNEKAIELISKEFLCYDNESDEYIQGKKAISILNGGD